MINSTIHRVKVFYGQRVLVKFQDKISKKQLAILPIKMPVKILDRPLP